MEVVNLASLLETCAPVKYMNPIKDLLIAVSRSGKGSQYGSYQGEMSSRDVLSLCLTYLLINVESP